MIFPYLRRSVYFLLLALLPFIAIAEAEHAITYQGQLQKNGSPFSGSANLEFRLFDASVEGAQIGSTQYFPAHDVAQGLFEVDLDFGPSAFDGQARWIEVRANEQTLIPRQLVRAAPIALYALDGNEGPQGPEGPPGYGFGELVRHTETKVMETDNSVYDHHITCPDGGRIISAGWRITNLNPFSMYVHGSWPNPTNSSRWNFQFRYAGSGNNVGNLELSALCESVES